MTDDADASHEYDFQDDSLDRPSERCFWRDRAGQILNFWTYAGCVAGVVALWMLMPGEIALYASAAIVLIGLIEWVKLHNLRYELTGDTLVKRFGILTGHKSPIPLYRIEDSEPVMPLMLRVFGRGHVHVVSSDRFTPRLRLSAIRDPEKVENLLRRHYERARSRKGTRVIE